MDNNRVWQLAAKKMAGEASPEEIRELEMLLKEDPDLHYALQNISDIWNLAVKQNANGNEAYSRHEKRMKEAGILNDDKSTESEEFERSVPVRKKSRGWWISSVAAFIIVLAFAFYLINVRSSGSVDETQIVQTEKNEISTRNGSRSKITLPDGSQVWLNAGSKLGYSKAFGTGSRQVDLSGEAYFDVVHNADLPFIIHTQQVEIRVLGTAFNVKSYPGDKQTETSLVRGKVEIRILNRPGETIILKPTEKLVVKNDGIQETVEENMWRNRDEKKTVPLYALDKMTHSKSDTSVVIETAWVDNMLAFENEAFDDLASKMKRWYGLDFHFRDESLTKQRFSGSFTNETVQQALEALSITSGGFHFRIQNNVVEVFK